MRRPAGRLLRRLLERVLAGDEWGGEFLGELDRELERMVRARGGGWRVRLWYLRQVLSPATLGLVWRIRRRRGRGASTEGGRTRDERRGTMGMATTGRGTTSRGIGEAVEDGIEDVRRAARGLAREGPFTGFAVLTLALGIGGGTAMLGVADRLFLGGPAHVERPGELARVYLSFTGGGDAGAERTSPWLPLPLAEALTTGGDVPGPAAAYRVDEELVGVGADARPLRIGSVGPGWFPLLGTETVAGRWPRPGELDAVAVAYELAVGAFGGAAAALGGSLELANRQRTVVGVAPAGFTGVELGAVDAWAPMDETTARTRNWQVVVRAPTPAGGAGGAVALGVLDERLEGLLAGLSNQVPAWTLAGRPSARPVAYDAAGEEPAEVAVARLLLAVVGLVLVIACANVVNLLLARLTRRGQELGIRRALGAGTARMTGLLLTESVVLALVAGVASLPVAWITGDLLRSVLLPEVQWTVPPVGARALVVTVTAALAAGLAIGVLPAVRAGREGAIGLRSGGRGGTSRSRLRLHRGLAGLQTALAAALLACAGLFLQSFATIRATDLGVDAEGVLLVRLRSLDPASVNAGSEAERDLYGRGLMALQEDPGVAAAALSVGVPFLANFSTGLHVPGLDSIPALPGGGPYLSAVSGGYFEAAGTDILRGRGIAAADVSDDAPVIVVSASMAALLWPGRDPLGACVHVGRPDAPCSRVVGVAEDVHRLGYREPPSMQFYVPLGRAGGFGGMALLVRPSVGRAASAAGVVRDRLAALDPALHHVEVSALAALLEPQVRPWRLGATVLGVSAILALVVSLAGVYGVLAYGVAQRRREIGLRLAVGASGASIRGLVVRSGAAPALYGLVVGILFVLASARWIEPLLFETSAADPLVLGAVALLLGGAALLACLLPAGAAARIEPMRTLQDG